MKLQCSSANNNFSNVHLLSDCNKKREFLVKNNNNNNNKTVDFRYVFPSIAAAAV